MPIASLAGELTRAQQGLPVVAWVPYTGGRYRQVQAYAGEWTPTVVHLRWYDSRGAWDIWVWAAAVQRSRSGRIVGLPATMRPTPNTVGRNRRPAPES